MEVAAIADARNNLPRLIHTVSVRFLLQTKHPLKKG